jgi:steroid delta-isomerase-like uncharacterized protein
MSTAENVALMKRWFEEVWNEGRIATVTELLDADAKGFGQAGHGTGIHGPADFIPFVQRLRGAFPDIKTKVEEAFATDYQTVVRWSATMTHTGGDLGIPPTGRKVQVTGMTMVHIENGKIIAGWDNWDQLALLRQIGVVPEADQSHPTLMELKKGMA